MKNSFNQIEKVKLYPTRPKFETSNIQKFEYGFM